VTIRVMLVDDQDLLRMGLAMVLQNEDDITVVGEAADGFSAVERARELRPDVILMDVRMPGLDGIEATRRIIAELPGARVIVLTTFDLDEYAFGGLNAGASGFLLKDAPPAELLAAIRAVHSGDASISPRITRRMLDLYSGKLPETGTRASGKLDQLTEREREVLIAIGRGLSNTEIASELFLSESTVKTHVGRILQKLELRDRVQAVILAFREGLV
jgi:DNA-binding NarL/FixJ family response regulator